MENTGLKEQEIIRRKSLQAIRELGIEPYPAAEFVTTTTSKKVKENYEEGKEVVIAGRMMGRRIMGKASFIELQDAEGRVQVYIARDSICKEEDKTLYNDVFKKLLDIGDIVGIKGYQFTTKVGEKSIHAEELVLLSKSLRPLPMPREDKDGKVHDAFTDLEMRYRQRYVDLIVNPHVRDIFVKRTKIIDTMRRFFNEQGYLEVDTPVLQAIPGGAAARPFETHHNALNIPLYLRIANELYLKRLIVGGFEGVYEFSRNFRNEGMDRTHNPEFTVMELYVAYKDYKWMMNFTEQLLEKIALEVHGTTEVKLGDKNISFKAPFQRVGILDAIKEHTGHDVYGMSEEELRNVCKELQLDVDETMGVGKMIDEIFGEKCEHHYVQPTFIIDYPKEMSPLTKAHREKEGLTERFELMVNGSEVANAYSELNDPIDQRERFEDQLKLSEKGDDEAMFIDQDFLRALEYGMPPNSGIGIGIDRLVMMMTNNASIQEVLLFPQMKPEKIAKVATASDFVKLGVPEDWANIALEEYKTVEGMKEQKATQIHQKLNGLRKKNKLDIAALQLEDVEKWLS